ncbi:SPOR domain-containing protein [Nitrogeniibacter aestuarii]|uniref:SPOR domain-containing protein n=1 Tax=Nitrogeniibacter aestuarii TaxID=2815343 RepID=UPI001D115318|nr:SPOR domain-containing protein [Nitrogeniibacter aestuarii]
MANDDAQTDLKKRARRRLVGAAALALFAVIVLPMIMDPEPKPAGEDIEVRIPPLSGVNVAERSIEPVPAPAVSEPVAPVPVKVPDTVVRPVEQKAAVQPDLPEKQPEPEKPAKAPAESPKTSAPVKPKSEEADRVAAILSGEAVENATGGPQFVVQVGAFSNASSASALAEKIRQAGFKAYTRKIGSTTRVRVGPFGDRDKAEAEASRMSGKGFKGVVMPRG